MRIVSAAEAVSVIQSGNRVFIHSVAAAPRRLIGAMTARAGELRVVEIVQLHTEGDAPYAAPAVSRSFRVNSVFVGPNLREAVQDGRADYLPVFLSEVPKLFRSGLLPLDVALVQDKSVFGQFDRRLDQRFQRHRSVPVSGIFQTRHSAGDANRQPA